jgi:hypothetical protein
MSRKAVRLRVVAVVLTALFGMFMAAVPTGAASAATDQAGSHGAVAHASRTAINVPESYAVVNITENACTSARATWVHITMNGTTRCYGGKGTFYFSGNNTTYFCAGNNYGNFRYFAGNTYHTLGFLPGTKVRWPNGVDATLLTINGWRGSNTC